MLLTSRPAELSVDHTSWTIYACLVGAAFALAVVRASLFYTVALRSAAALHAKMLKAILKAQVAFFDTAPSPSILNRFSKDTSCMDEVLPTALICAAQSLLLALSAVCLPIFLNPILAFPTVPLLVLFFACWRYYLFTARQVRGLEISNRVPVMSHFRETLKGLVIIRGNAMQESFVADFYR